MHPSREELSGFLQGTLPENVADSIAEHLDQCPDCDATLRNLGVESDTIVAAIRHGLAHPDAFADESGCRRLVERIQAIGRDPSFTTSPLDNAVNTPVPQRIGPYQLLAKLGEGGMGAVYKALHTRLKKVVALKILPAGRTQDQHALERFEREMEAVGRVEHPNIVRAMDADEHEGTQYLVMEYVDGLDLSAVVRAVGPLAIADACELIREAAIGLQHAHEHGLVHRDIKPGNLMLSTHGQVKILDLGLARLGGTLAPDRRELTNTGQVMGTLDYMAPEQGGDSREVDIRADIHSLGASLYRLLTGEPPFSGPKYDSPIQKLTALAIEPVPAIRTRRPEVSEPLAAVVHRMLAKNPAERYATPGEVAAALAPYVVGADLARLARNAVDAQHAKTSDLQLPATVSTDKHLSAHHTDTTSNRVVAAATPGASAQAGSSLWRRIPAPLVATAAGMAFIFFAATIWLVIRDKDGNEKTRIAMNPGDSLKIEEQSDQPGDATPTEKVRPVNSGGAQPQRLKPFVLLAADGDIQGEYTHWAEAMAVIRSGQTLEIHGNGPFPIVSSTSVENVDVAVRAAVGFRPQLVNDVILDGEPLFRVNAGRLRIVGCDVRSSSVTVVAVGGAEITFDNCRFDHAGLLELNDSHLKMTDCLCRLGSPFGNVATARGDCQIELKNNILYSQTGLHFISGRHTVELVGNTFVNLTCCTVNLAEPTTNLIVAASRNIFSGGTLIHTWKDLDCLRADAPQRLKWTGRDNLYSLGNLVSDSTHELIKLAEFGDYLKCDVASERETTESIPTWHLDNRSLGMVGEFTNLLGRLRADTLELRKRSDVGDDVGPDWSLVGSGEAYVAALRHAGVKLPDEALRPAAPEGGPFVVVHAGQIVQGFPALEKALLATESGDTIEIRGDGPFPPGQLSGKTITLRAAPGYRPVFSGNGISLVQCTATLEGLHFQASRVAGGTVARMANCSFAGPPVNHYVSGLGVSVDADHPTEIVNCLVPGSLEIWSKRAAWSVRNSLVGEMLVNLTEVGTAQLALDHVYLFSPVSTAIYPQTSVEGKLAVTVRRSIIDAHRGLFGHRFVNAAFEAYQGTANVYRLPHGPWYVDADRPSDAHGIEDLRRHWQSKEEGSAVAESLLLDPQFWRLPEKSAGHAAGPDGKDLGADVDRVARTVAEIAAFTENGVQRSPLMTNESLTVGPIVKPDKIVSIKIEPEGLPKRAPNEPLTPTALVQKPATIPGIRSWSIELIPPRGPVHAVEFLPDGKYYATAGHDRIVRIWDAKTDCVVRMLMGHTGIVNSVAWSPDGSYLASRGLDATVRIWNSASGAAVRIINTGNNDVANVAWSPDGQRLAFNTFNDPEGGKIAIWNAEIDDVEREFSAFGGGNRIAWSPDGTHLAVGGKDKTIRLWNVATGATIKTLSVHETPITGLAWSPDGRWLASSEYQWNGVFLWSVEEGRRVAQVIGGGDHRPTWHPDGTMLSIAGAAPFPVSDPPNEVGLDPECVAVAWSPDGKIELNTGNYGHVVKVPTGPKRVSSVLSRWSIWNGQVAWSHDGTALATQSWGFNCPGTLTCWDTTKFSPRWTQLHGASIGWQPGTDRLAVGDRDLVLLDPRTRDTVETISELQSAYGVVAWTHDGQRLAAGGQDGVIRVLDYRTKKVVQELPKQKGKIRHLAWSADDQLLAADIAGDVVRIWDATNAKEIHHSEFDGQMAIAWSPQRRLLALPNFTAWNIDEDSVVHSHWKEPVGYVASRSMDWSRDGHWLAGGGERVQFCNTQTREVITRVGPHYHDAMSVAWSPDGKHLASADFSAGVFVWDAATHEPIAFLVTIPGTGEADKDRHLAISAASHYHGSPGVEEKIRYVVETDAGKQLTLTAEEFATKYGWKNDPSQVRLETADKPAEQKPRPIIDLLPRIDPNRDAVKGAWTRNADGLKSDGSIPFCRLTLPYEPPAEYDFRIEFTAKGGNDVLQLLAAGNRSFSFLMGGWGGRFDGFDAVAGHPFLRDGTNIIGAPSSIRPGQRHTAVIQVRKNLVRAEIDGKQVVEHRTDGADLSMPVEWTIPIGRLGLGTTFDETVFHRIEVVEVSGAGKVIE